MPTTWNPADRANMTLSGGNLIATPVGGAGCGVRSVASVTTGKYYFEVTFAAATGNAFTGVANPSCSLTGVGSSAGNASIVQGDGTVYVNGSVLAALGSFTAGQVACVALDISSSLIWFRRGAAGNWNNSGTANPATGVGGISLNTMPGWPTMLYALACGNSSSNTALTANFGGAGFSGVVPSGFIAGFPDSGLSVSQARAMVLA